MLMCGGTEEPRAGHVAVEVVWSGAERPSRESAASECAQVLRGEQACRAEAPRGDGGLRCGIGGRHRR